MESAIDAIKEKAVRFAEFQLETHGVDADTVAQVKESITAWVEAAYNEGMHDSYEAFNKKTTEQYANFEKILSGAGSSVL